MEEVAETSPLQFLLIELSLGFSRDPPSRRALLLNGGAGVALLLFFARNLAASP